MAEINDTRRLYWLLQTRPDMDSSRDECWVVYYREVEGVRRKVVSCGKNYIDAIDNAINKVYKVAD